MTLNRRGGKVGVMTPENDMLNRLLACCALKKSCRALKEMARESFGISEMTLWRWRHGKCQPRKLGMTALSRVLDQLGYPAAMKKSGESPQKPKGKTLENS